MYWPLGTPRIFSAKVTNPVTTYNSDYNHEAETLVAVSPTDDAKGTNSSSGGKKPVELDGPISEGDNRDTPEQSDNREDEESAFVGDRGSRNELLDPHRALGASLEDAKKSGSSLDVTFSEETNEQVANNAILALKMSRNGALFATITVTELTIWQTKVRPAMQAPTYIYSSRR